jgi:intracellular sulfur oxidation DsrE/DsrF family protein
MKPVVMLAALLVAATAAFSSPSVAQQASGRHKLVLQVSDGDAAKWNLALNNAENVQQALGKDKVDVEIVAYGPGLGMLTAESKVAARLNGAMDNNVALLACGTTMKKAKLTAADLAGGVKVVPAGVIHIMQRQSEGWSYVRP